MSNPNAFDLAAVAAVRGFANRLATDPRAAAASRIELTLCGRGPIERLFALEAALLAAWPTSLRRPAHDLVSTTGALGPAAGLTLRAFDADGAELLRGAYEIDPSAVKQRPARAHG